MSDSHGFSNGQLLRLYALYALFYLLYGIRIGLPIVAGAILIYYAGDIVAFILAS